MRGSSGALPGATAVIRAAPGWGGTGSPEVSQGGGNGVWGWRDALCMLRWGEPLTSPAGRGEAKPLLCPLFCPPI